KKISEELGDLVFLGVFCLELLRDQSGIGIDQSLRAAADKLIRRHPHVYGDVRVEGGDAAYHQWQHIKQREQGTKSLLGEQPPGLAALAAAHPTQEQAGGVGFDCPDLTGLPTTAREEVREGDLELRGEPADEADGAPRPPPPE